jgi:hypothetical protein
MAYKTKESRKERKNPPVASTQAVQQEVKQPSPQGPEYQAPIPGLDTKEINPELILRILNFLLLQYLFFSVLTSPSLFSNSYSYVLHFPSFSCGTIHCFSSQLLFLLLLIYSLPIFASLSYHSPTCHHRTLPSYTLATSWLDNCANSTHPQCPAILDKNTLHYNSGNTSKLTQGPQNPAAPTLLSPYFLSPHFSATFTNYPSFYL